MAYSMALRAKMRTGMKKTMKKTNCNDTKVCADPKKPAKRVK